MKRYIISLLIILSVLPLYAQIRGNNITVTVTPDHKDWNYKVGEKAVFKVSVLKSGTLLDNVKVDIEAGPEMYPEISKKEVLLKDGMMTWTGMMKTPGFYRLKVIAHVSGKNYEGLCTVGYDTDKLTPRAECPDDFDSFWTETLKEARYTPLEPTCELLADRCTKDVNVYQVSFQNMRWGSRTYGILCVPSKPGKYPALLRVPGAGIRPYTGDVWIASKGCITLEIGVHGIPVTMSQDFYDKLANGALSGYWTFNVNDRYANYYRRVFVGAVRAIDYIATLPEWNGTKLGVTGSSQGGMLSLVCAALDKRVTCYGAVHAAMCDHAASLKGVACGWPHYFYGKKNVKKEDVKASGYYDGVNFARRITCPGWFSFGYNDDVVPPTTAFATYNAVTVPKTLSVYQQTGHYWYQEQWDEWNEWLMKELGI